MPRPRQVTDEQIMRAAWGALGRLGFAGFTLAAVATEVGVSPVALHRRYGSKRALFAALYDYMGVANRTAVMGHGRPSLAGLREAFLGAASHGDPQTYANLLSILPEVVNDPLLRTKAAERHRILERAVADVLRASVENGELACTDVERLSRVLLAACAGAPLLWAQDSAVPVADRIRECLDVLLQPLNPQMRP